MHGLDLVCVKLKTLHWQKKKVRQKYTNVMVRFKDIKVERAGSVTIRQWWFTATVTRQ